MSRTVARRYNPVSADSGGKRKRNEDGCNRLRRTNLPPQRIERNKERIFSDNAGFTRGIRGELTRSRLISVSKSALSYAKVRRTQISRKGTAGGILPGSERTQNPRHFVNAEGLIFWLFSLRTQLRQTKNRVCREGHARFLCDFSPILCPAAGEKIMNHNNRRMMLTNWKMLPSRTKMCQTQCIYPFFLPMA